MTLGVFTYKCSCGTIGSFRAPMLGANKSMWECVSSSGVAIQGVVGATGHLSRVTGAVADGSSTVLSCTGP